MTARADVLTAQLRSAMTKAERRRAVRQFSAPEAEPVEARSVANAELRRFLTEGSRVEERAASEATNTAGGFTVRPLWAEVIRYLKSFDEILNSVEVFETLTGAPLVRPQVSSFVAAPSASVAEGTQVADSSATLPVFGGNQAWGLCSSWPITLFASNQLVADSGTDLLALLGSAAAEAVHRKLASVLQAALIASATGPQTVALGSLTVDNVASMLGKMDAAFLPNARLYVSAGDLGIMAKADPTGLRHLADLIPGGIVASGAVSNWATGTTSGPILADMGSYFTWRQAPGFAVVSRELRAELAQTAIVVALRADFAATGRTAAAVYAN